MKYLMTHKGKIVEVNGDMIVVEFHASDASGCSGCALSSSCGTSGSSRSHRGDKVTVEVRLPDSFRLRREDLVGRDVVVGARAGSSARAAGLLFALPLGIMLAGAVVGVLCGLGEGATAAVSLGAAAVTLVGVYAVSRWQRLSGVWAVVEIMD